MNTSESTSVVRPQASISIVLRLLFSAAIILLLLLAAPAFAQNVRVDNVTFSSVQGFPFLPGATITICTAAASGLPCSPTVAGTCLSISDVTCNQSAAITSDAFGNYGFWIQPGSYTYTVTKAGFGGFGPRALTLACQPTATCTMTAPQTINSNLTVSGTGTVANINSIIFVCLSASCTYQTLAAGIAALPSCTVSNSLNPFTNPPSTYNTYTYTHCGTIVMAPGTYTSSTETDILGNPAIRIVGDANLNTVWNFTGASGCYLKWTGATGFEFVHSPVLENIVIDGGQSNSAGTCGLLTSDLASFHARNVHIQNFNGSGSVCWDNQFNLTSYGAGSEKYDVDMETANCGTAWRVLKAAAGGNNTFGYGRFSVKSWVFSGQTGLLVDGGTCIGQNCGSVGFSNSFIHFSINGVSNPANYTALLLRNGAQMGNNTIVFHFETPFGIGTGHDISIDSTSNFTAVGTIDQPNPGSNQVTGTFSICGFTNFQSAAAGSMNGSCVLNNVVNNTIGGVNPIGFTLLETANTTTTDVPALQSTLNQTIAKTTGWLFNIRGITNYSGTGTNSGNAFGVFGTSGTTSTGTMPFAQGVGGQAQAAGAAGTVTSGRAFHALTPNISGGGLITNAYGLYVDAQKIAGVTNGFGIFSAGATDTNVLTGGLGTPLASNTALQIFNTTTTCTTAPTAFITCTTANITLPVAEADTSYRLSCTPHGPTNFPVLVGTTIVSATQFTITIEATTAAAATFASYDCVAGHN